MEPRLELNHYKNETNRLDIIGYVLLNIIMMFINRLKNETFNRNKSQTYIIIITCIFLFY